MRYGHGPRGIIRITLKPETLKMWALGLHICSRLEQDIADITEGKGVTSQETHKEETSYQLSQMTQMFSCSLFIIIKTRVLLAPCS